MDQMFVWAMIQREIIRFNSRFQSAPGRLADQKRHRRSAFSAMWKRLER